MVTVVLVPASVADGVIREGAKWGGWSVRDVVEEDEEGGRTEGEAWEVAFLIAFFCFLGWRDEAAG